VHSRRTLPIQRSAMTLARGARTGVVMTWMPTEANTASNAAVQVSSRSRIRNLSSSAR
jgi:hypothetical protein